jgi:hypothetical protein
MKRIAMIDNLPGLAHYRRDRFICGDAAAFNAAVGGNTGNLAFVYGIERMIAAPLEPVTWAAEPQWMRERFDALVVCCANQLGAHVTLSGWAERLQAFDLPVTLIGLGAQADQFDHTPELPTGTLRLLEVVERLRPNPAYPNIALRGDFSRRVLEGVGYVGTITGCPSLMISPDLTLGASLVERQSDEPFKVVAVTGGNPWHGPSAQLESQLVELVESFCGAYLPQHPESMIRLALGEGGEEATLENLERLLDGRFAGADLIRWYARKSHLFLDVPHWMRFLQHFDVVVGPRYHGVALGIQAAVAGCVVVIDARTQELCESSAIKYLTLDEALRLNAVELAERGRWSTEDGASFDRLRYQRAADMAAFLCLNGLQPSPHLTGLAACAA